jgi:ADP-heptose:LPS heptosyltransferase
LLKRLEARWKRAWMRLFARVFGVTRRRQPADWSAGSPRVLYLRYDRIGDMIMATSLIRAIKLSHPNIILDVLGSRANAPVLQHNPRVSTVRIFDRRSGRSFVKTMWSLLNSGYDAIIDGMVLTPSLTMMLLMLSSRAPYRIGIGGRENDFVYSLPVPAPPPDEHHIAHSAATALPFGVDPERTDWRPEIFLARDEVARAEHEWVSRFGAGAQRILINMSAGQPRRRWPDESFIALARHLTSTAHGRGVLVMAAPNERESAERIAAAGRAQAAIPQLRDAFALVATADVIFTPDTSIAHAASAFSKPTVVMMIERMNIFAPFETPGEVLYSDGPTLASLSVDTAIAALDRVIATLPSAR